VEPIEPAALSGVVPATSGSPAGGARRSDLGPDDRSQPAGRIFALVLSGLQHDCLSHQDGVLADRDPEELHDLRVAVRRTRSLLRAATGVLPETDRRTLRDELRWLAELTSPVRDLDVLAEDLPSLAKRLSPELGTALPELRAELDSARVAAVSRLSDAIRSDRYVRLQRTWQHCGRIYVVQGDVPESALRPAGDVADEMVLRSERRMRRIGRRAVRSDDLTHWHDLRKALKQFRYVLAEVSPLYPADTFRTVRSELPELQDLLGRLQDHHVQAELVAGVGLDAGGRAALVAGALSDRLHRDVHRAHHRCRAAWRRFERSDVAARLCRELGRDT